MMIKLLVVDDNELILRALNDFLKLERPVWKTIMAHGCSEAKEFIAIHKPDAALLDVFLEDGNGFDIMTYLRSMEPRFPVVMMSGSPPVSFAGHMPQESKYRIIEKPFHMNSLIETIESEFNAASFVPRNGNGNGGAKESARQSEANIPAYDPDYIAKSSHPMLQDLRRSMESQWEFPRSGQKTG